MQCFSTYVSTRLSAAGPKHIGKDAFSKLALRGSQSKLKNLLFEVQWVAGTQQHVQSLLSEKGRTEVTGQQMSSQRCCDLRNSLRRCSKRPLACWYDFAHYRGEARYLTVLLPLGGQASSLQRVRGFTALRAHTGASVHEVMPLRDVLRKALQKKMPSNRASQHKQYQRNYASETARDWPRCHTSSNPQDKKASSTYAQNIL